nr:MATE family efflux transporter [Clostridia bacterium]
MTNIFSTKTMVKPDIQLGELPSSKEAYTTLFRLAAPSVAEMLLTSLIGMIDTVMVSGLGEEAIAAVGLTTQPRMLVMAIFVALNAGLTAVIARRKGEERRDDANRSLSSMVTVILLLAILLASLAVTFANPIMRFAGAVEGETLEIGMSYYRILIAAAPLNAVTMAINAAQRGIGKTKITMYVNMAANIVNVIFNYLLIEGRFGFPRLEIEGAAIASVIGICVGFIMAIISITVHKGYLRLSIREMLRPSGEALMPVIKVGGNAVLEQVAMRIGFFTFAKIVAGLGTDNMAAHQIILQFTTISFTVGDGIGVAGTSLVG